MTIAIVTVEDAINAWIAAGSGFDADTNVIWAQQAAPRPATPYIALRMTLLEQHGQDWYDIRDAAVPAPGAEIDAVVRGVRKGTLNIACFGDAATGVNMPAMTLDNVMLAARLPSVRDALNIAQIGINGFSPIRSIDGGPTATVFEPRAILDCRFNVPTEVAETLTYIELVEVTDQITGEMFTVDSTP